MIFLVKPFVADTTKHWTQQVYIFLQSVNVSEVPTADTKSDSLLPRVRSCFGFKTGSTQFHFI